MNSIEKYNRLEQLKNFVFKQNRVMVDDIVQYFNVSYPTARRYVELLVKDNDAFMRVRSGVIVKKKSNHVELFFNEKLNVMREEKRAIAKYCSSIISEGQSIILDSGSTCYFLAEELNEKQLKVVTTDLKISMELSHKKNISLFTVGGEVRSGYYSICGDMAKNNISMFNVDTAIMSADSIDIEKGITNSEIFEVSVKREIKQHAKKLILLADSSKFENQSFYFVMPLLDIDIIITDSNISEEVVSKIRKKNIEVIITDCVT